MGELYEVLGALRFSLAEACPEELIGKTIKLKCNDDFVFSVAAEVGCVAGAVRRTASQDGIEKDVPVPLKRATMAKVIDYMKHHKDSAPKEISTPLISNDLAECGASRWDVKFVDVDKAMLFDLNLASSVLDIASLFFLTSAKTAIIMKNKSPEKLRKEFNFLNDLPRNEEESMQRELEASGKTKSEDPGSEISALAVTLQATAVAAEKHGCLDTDRNEVGVPVVDLRSWRHATWRAVVLLDWNQLAMAPQEIRGDRDLMFAALMVSQGQALQYASSELRADRKVVLEATKYFGTAFQEADSALRGDKEFVLEAINAHPAALTGASDSVRNDRDVILEAARKGCGLALEGAHPQLQRDRNFVLELLTIDPQAYKYAAEELRESKDFAIEAASRSGRSLQHMPSKFKADRDVVTAAVEENVTAALFAHTSRRGDLGVGLPWDSEVEHKQIAPGKPGIMEVGLMPKGPRNVNETDEWNCTYWHHKIQKSVQFSAMSVMTGNIGQANYVAADIYLDKLPAYQRPEIDAVTLMWGAVGHIGMRWKAFGSNDFLNQTPEALLSIPDASKVLQMTCCRMQPPEWYCATLMDINSREAFLTDTAGAGSGGHWAPSEDAPVYPVIPPESEWNADGLNKGFLIGKDLEDERAPLGGWPGLRDVKSAGRRAPFDDETPKAPRPTCALEVGARAELVGLSTKVGATGILLKLFADGRWKVCLDDGTGNALLKGCYLKGLQPASEVRPISDQNVPSASGARRAKLEASLKYAIAVA